MDEDSLNRHLSHNRQCSRADIEATDKLSMLLPDPSYTAKQTHGGAYSSVTQFFLHGGNGTEVLDQLQGDLVNFVNAFDLNYLHQLQTSLHGPVTKVHKDSKEITVVIFEDPLMTLQKEPIKNSPIVVNQQQVQQPEIEEIWMAPPHQDFDVGEYDDNDDDVNSDIINDDVETINPTAAAGEPIAPDTIGYATGNTAAIHHAFTGGSQELDSLVELYAMLDKRGVANTLFDKITKWAWLNAGTFSNTPPMKRDLVVHKVFRHVRGDEYKDFMHPKQKIIRLSTGRLVAITYFPLENMIKDLLTNATLMDKENLLFSNFSNPVAGDVTCNDQSLFGDVDTGTWWKCAKEHECREERDILWPLIMFIDGMKVDEMSGKLKLEPISFTFSRFKRFVRHQDNAWRTWCYIEDVKQPPRLRPVGEEDAMLTSKDRLQEYHDILFFLMNDLKRVQANGIPWALDFGEEGKHDVVLRLPIQFIIGDCEGHDKLAGRYKGHTQNIKGLCRDCDVPTHHAVDENWVCSFFNQREMDALNEDDLRAKSFHKLQNGLRGVSIGGCERGIYGILIPEMLHLYKNGHCDWQFEAFAFSLSTRSTDISTQVTAFLVNSNRGQSDRSYPDIGTFRYGIITSQGVVLKGHQKHARIFIIYILLSCSEFVKSLDYNQKRGSGYDVRFYVDFVQMLEHSLAFYEWSMKREHDINTIIGHDGTTETSKAQQSVRRYLSLMKRCCLREEMGKTYKMPKFHQSLHLVSAIVRHGSLANVDGSRPESMAKGNVKDPASHTQRVTSKLSYQTGKRYMESLTFREYKRLRQETDSCSITSDESAVPYINNNTEEAQMVRNIAEDDSSVRDESSSTHGSTKFLMSLDVDQPNGQCIVVFEWLGRGKRPLKDFDDHLLLKLGQRLFCATDGGIVVDNDVPGCTSVTVKGTKYTAHPSFKNDHIWHDWVYIQWDGYAEPVPARIDMFFDLTNSNISQSDPNQGGDEQNDDDNEHTIKNFDHQYLENKIYAVVWSAKSLTIPRHKLTEYHIPLNLAFRVEMEQCRRIIPVECFVKPCYGMINYCGIDQEFDMTAIIMKERSVWPDFFLE